MRSRVAWTGAFAMTVVLPVTAHASPALITLARGPVEIVSPTGTRSVTAPDRLQDGEALEVRAGGMAVVLADGKAQQLLGPARYITAPKAGAAGKTDSSVALARVLERQSSSASVGATRGDDALQLTCPVPDSPLVRLTDIRWACASCGETTAEIIDQQTFDVVWASSGKGSVVYVGPPLEPGAYAVRLGGDRYVSFSVVEPSAVAEVQRVLEESRRLTEALGPTERASVEAAVLRQAGFATDALQAILGARREYPGTADLDSLLRSYEAPGPP
jgi:hypothetical protein